MLKENNVSVKTTSNNINNLINELPELDSNVLNIISCSYKGKAFVPTYISNNNNVLANNIDNIIGNFRNNKHLHVYDTLSANSNNTAYETMKLWLDNGGRFCVHTRVLGIGNGEYDSEKDTFTNSGFKLGQCITFNSSDNITCENNFTDNSITSDENNNFLFATLSSQNFNNEKINYFKFLGLKTSESYNFISKMIFTPKNIELSLNDENDLIKLTGFKNNDFNQEIININQTNEIKLSAENISKNCYLPEYIRESGHYIYKEFVINKINDQVGFSINDGKIQNFDYGDFENKYEASKSPWIISQKINKNENFVDNFIELFRFHSLNDGDIGNKIRIKINPLSLGRKNNNSKNLFSRFDVIVYEYEPRDNSFSIVERFLNLSLDYDDSDYIGRRIGTSNIFYDHKKNMLIENKGFENKSRYIRVQINDSINDKKLENSCLLIPFGFKSYPKIKLKEGYISTPVDYVYIENEALSEIENVTNNWGVQFYTTNDNFTQKYDLSSSGNVIKEQTNAGDFILSPYYFHSKFLLENRNNDTNILEQDDNYLNGLFSLNRLKYDDTTDELLYIRNNEDDLSNLDLFFDDLNINNKFENRLSFDFFLYGGFDGVNIFDYDKRFFNTNSVIIEEYNDIEKNSINSYKKAIDLNTEETFCKNDIICLPDISSNILNDYLQEKSELNNELLVLCDVSSVSNFEKNIEFNNNYNFKQKINSCMNSLYYPSNYTTDYFLNKTSININRPEYESNIKLQFDNLFYNHYYSRNLVPFFGDLVFDNENIMTIIKPHAFSVSRFIENNNNSIIFFNNIFNINNVDKTISALFDIKNIQNLAFNNFEYNTKKIRDLRINVYLNNRTKENVILNSQYTSYNERDSLFREIKNIKVLKEIKTKIKLLLIRDSQFFDGGYLFNNNNSFNNVQQKLEVELNNLLSNFVSSGLIKAYKVNSKNKLNFNTESSIGKENLNFSVMISFNNQIDNISFNLSDIVKNSSLLEQSILYNNNILENQLSI